MFPRSPAAAFATGAVVAIVAGRLSTAAGAASPWVGRAPFQISDRNGIALISVVETPTRRLDIHDKSGRVVASLVTSKDGGWLTLFDPAQKDFSRSSLLGVTAVNAGAEHSPRLSFVDQNVPRAVLERRPRGNYGSLFFNAKGAALAGVGEDPETGAGLAFVTDQMGNQRVQVRGDTRDANVKVFATNKTVIAALSRTRAARQGGYLQIDDAAGTPVVDAGPNESNDGVVRTGPASMGVSGLGTPGSYILGMK